MQISFSCDSCKSPFTVDAQLAGRHGRCNACGHRTLIPSPVVTDRADARQKDRRPGGSVAAAGPTFDPQRGRSEARLATGPGPSPAGGRSVGWLNTVNSQIALKLVSMEKVPVVRRRTEEVEDPATSYKAVIPRELRQKHRITSRPAGKLRLSYLRGINSYQQFFRKFSWLFRWINETAYGLAIPFMLLAIVGGIMNNHSLTVMGLSVIVLLNIVRLVAGLANLIAISFRDSPIKGLLFLIPPVTVFLLWQNRKKWHKTIKRSVSPVLTIFLVLLAYAYVPWLNGNKKAQANLGNTLRNAARNLENDLQDSVSKIKKKGREVEGELPRKMEKLKLNEIKDQALKSIDDLSQKVRKSTESNSLPEKKEPDAAAETAPKVSP